MVEESILIDVEVTVDVESCGKSSREVGIGTRINDRWMVWGVASRIFLGQDMQAQG